MQIGKRDSAILTGKGVEGSRRCSEEVALGIDEIRAVLQGPELGN
jgi:hypothetical protein